MRTLPALALTLLALTLPAPTAPAQQTKKEDPADTKKSVASEFKVPEKVAGRTLDEWRKRLHSTDPEVRRDAVRAVLGFGPAAAVAVPDVIHMADLDRDISPRVNAIIVLMLIEIKDRDVPQAVQVLRRRVSSDYQAVVRLHAALALGRFEEQAKDAVPDLVNASKDNASAEIRRAAIGSLGKVGVDKKKKTPPDHRATNAVLQALRPGFKGPAEPSAKVRLEAVMVLGAMGAPATPMLQNTVIQTLTRSLRDPDKTVVVWAHVALMALENKVTEARLKGIAALLKHKDPEVRMNAARALGQLGGYADKDYIKLVKAHVPDLLSALKDSEPDVVSMSCWALGQLGNKSSVGDEVNTALTALKEDKKKDPGVRLMALAALESIKGKKGMKELKDIKKDIDKEKEKDKPKKPVLP
jgi:HEAT repeat protein